MTDFEIPKKKKLAVVLNILDEEYQTSFFSGVTKRAEELNIDIICFQHEDAQIHEKTLVASFPTESFFDVDGIILLSSVFSDCPELQNKNTIRRLWGKTPVISVGQKIEGIPSLAIRGHDAMKKLTEHLILEHKYKNFLYISGIEDHIDSKDRLEVFKSVIENYQKTNPALKYTKISGNFSELEARERIAHYIESNPTEAADVIVCANDNMALGVEKYITTQTKNPAWASCAVTGFDDIPQAQIQVPAFTTVHQPLEEMGVKAIDYMLDILNNKAVSDMVYVEAELVIRESCGCKQIPEDKIFTNIKQERVNQIQHKYFQSEQLLRRMGHFGLQLNACSETDGLMYTLETNLSLLDVDNFGLYAFDNPFKGDTPLPHKNLKVQELFLRKNGKRVTQYGPIKQGIFNNFLNNLWGSSPHPLVVKMLNTSSGITGCIIYDAPNLMHPYICSISTNIAQTIFRLQTLAAKEKYSETLEEEVTRRTKELVIANSRRIQVEAEVLKISEMERQRFSTDLHDDICQRLAGIAMLCRSYTTFGTQISKEQMSELTDLITETLQATRQYAHNSFPVEIDSLGMKDSLGNLCASFQTQNNIICNYSWDIPETDVFNRMECINIFRIIQEALHNISKHSKATEAKVELFQSGKKIYVRISDNGKGYSQNNDKRPGIGMKSMQYRADQIQASFIMKQNHPTGTIIELILNTAKKKN